MKAIPLTVDESEMRPLTISSTRKRYSREFVLSRKEISANMKFPVLSIPTKAPRGARKISQSNDQKGHKTQEGSREDLDIEEPDGSHAWHRVGRGQWNVGNSHHPQPFQPPNHASVHPRPRYPSGSHGDSDSFVSSTINASLRPAPDTRRGGHGDWSRGCAGWRQRSYSGSERSGVVIGQHPRGRGTGTLFGVDSDDTHTRGRGRGRGFVPGSGSGRFTFPHRGAGPNRATQSTTIASRPTGSGSGLAHAEDSEEFWQEEDWASVCVEPTGSGTKSRERLNSFTHTDLPPVAEQICPQGEPEQLIRDMSNLRVYSKSCSLEPPPGFDIPSSSQQPSSGVPATLTTPPISSLPRPMMESTMPTASDSKVTENAAPITSQQPSGTQGSAALGFKWLYVDSSGQIQGPFSNAQMSGWMAAGFLPLGIELRRDCDECFLTLADHINLAGRVPFWDGYSLKPITQSNAAALAQTLITSTGHALGKPRWISNVTTEGPTLTSSSAPSNTPLAPPFTASAAGGTSTTLNNKTAVAAAAAATAVLFATQQAARMVAPGRPQTLQQHTSIPAISSAQVVPDLPTVVGVPGAAAGLPSVPLTPAQVPIDLVNGSQEFIRLYTEAQALAVHAAKVEAERKELVEKLAVINSTAAKLLGSTPDFSMVKSPETLPPPDEVSISPTPDSKTEQSVVQPTTTKPPEVQSIPSEEVAQLVPNEEPNRHRTASTGSSDEQRPVLRTNEERTDEEPITSSPDSNERHASIAPQPTTGVTMPDTHNDSGTVSGDGVAKKSGKKKNKKAKKNK